MKYLKIVIVMLLASCRGIGIDADEEHMALDCKCEQSGANSDFSIKGEHVRGCARKIGDLLKWGFIIDNNVCDLFLPFIYDNAGNFACGLAPVKKGDSWGAIDTAGELKIDYKYSNLGSFSDSLAIFSNENDKMGMYNNEGGDIPKTNL